MEWIRFFKSVNAIPRKKMNYLTAFIFSKYNLLYNFYGVEKKQNCDQWRKNINCSNTNLSIRMISKKDYWHSGKLPAVCRKRVHI